ncbi:MAG: hypothetical protein ACRCT8_04980 [Lacipirellulaceae bacterium]
MDPQAMVFEAIEQQKRELTDKYVIVTGAQVELARFEGVVGRVKAVNLNGRALVEFNGYHNNVGWFDIDPTFLRVVDKPPEDPAPLDTRATKGAPASKIPAKSPAKSAADVLAAARGGAAKPPAGGVAKLRSPSASKSPAEVLAAARAARGGASDPPAAVPPTDDAPSEAPSTAKRTSPAVSLSTADVIAAARAKAATKASTAPTSAATEAPPPRKQPAPQTSTMTTAEILAAARAKKSAPAAQQSGGSAAAPGAAAAKPAPPRQLSAADILAIANGQQSLRREQPIATAPNAPKAERSTVGVLHAAPERAMVSAADILALGDWVKPRPGGD